MGIRSTTASGREVGTGAGGAHAEGIECQSWPWIQNEDYYWFCGNRAGVLMFDQLWMVHNWKVGHAIVAH